MRKLLPVTAAVCAALLIAAPVGADEEEDQEIADDVVAETASLVPATFEEDAPSEDSDVAGPQPCDEITETVDDAKEGPFAEVSYTDPADTIGLTEVGASVYVFSKPKKAKRFANALTSEDSEACAGTIVARSGGGSYMKVRISRASGLQLTINGEGYALVIQQVRARIGRAVLVVSASSQNEPLDFMPDLLSGLEGTLGEAL